MEGWLSGKWLNDKILTNSVACNQHFLMKSVAYNQQFLAKSVACNQQFCIFAGKIKTLLWKRYL